MSVCKVCFVTGTRADWGLLTPLARELSKSGRAEVSVVATNMHLMERYGMTVHEIEDAGFMVNARVPMDVPGEDEASRVRAMSLCMQGMADAFLGISPDVVVILGDRFEMLAVASAALIMRIPIVHIAGGTVSEGAIDDSVRHAITKMAALHFVETEKCRKRVLQMGEAPEKVIVTGALGVWNIMHQKLLSASEFKASLDGFELSPESSLLVTYHPVTLDNENPASRFCELLDALDRFPDSNVLITYPNNDAGGDEISRLVESYAAANSPRVKAVRSLGMVRYLSALRCVAAVVGNSSSGIVEVPSMHIPTVDIGRRQQGRECSRSVIHVADRADEIASAIAFALSPEGRGLARNSENPYFKPDTVKIMANAIMALDTETACQKKFHEI